MVLRRFVARRGRPRIIYSDNGTNFKGAYNALKKIDWTQIVNYNADLQIEWRFNPPTAAWWGGFWERLIGILKRMLLRILGKASLSQEEIYTVICECESYINARPLTYLTEDNEDPSPISPRMFLQEIEEDGVPDLDQIDSNTLDRRLRRRTLLKQELKERFRDEYLGQLIQHREKTPKEKRRVPVVGELVLIGSDDNKRRLNWPLAIIQKLVPGKDGKIRVAYLKTADVALYKDCILSR